MRRTAASALVVVAAGLGLSGAPAHGAVPYDVTLVSRNASGAAIGSLGTSSLPSFSANGRYVAFSTLRADLVAQDTDTSPDVFRLDTTTGALRLVSAGSQGRTHFGGADQTVISSSGRYVVFSSWDDVLGLGVTTQHVYRRDVQTGQTVLVTADATGEPSTGGGRTAAVSPDGRYVAFQSRASDLDGPGGDQNGLYDVWLKDVTTGAVTLVSRTLGGGVLPTGTSYTGLVSTGGTVVTFATGSNDTGANDTNGKRDLYRYDVAANTSRLVSVGTDGRAAGIEWDSTGMSSNGRYVAFASLSPRVVAGDTDATSDVFRFDATNGAVALMSPGLDDVVQPGLSANGRYVSFTSDYQNAAQRRVRRYDRQTRTLELVSVTNGGAELSAAAEGMSSDGRHIAFGTDQALVASDTNGAYDDYYWNARD